MYSSCFTYCAIITIIIIVLLVSFVGLILNIQWENEWQFYKLHTCNITSIENPVEIYSQNHTIGWVQCACDSVSGVSGCTKLYSNISLDKVIYSEYDINDGDCTIKTDCACGDLSIDVAYNDVMNTYNEYINKSVSCYYNDQKSNIYLSKDDKGYKDAAILCGVICFGIIFIFICCLGCRYFEKKMNDRAHDRALRKSIYDYDRNNMEKIYFPHNTVNESIYSYTYTIDDVPIPVEEVYIPVKKIYTTPSIESIL